MDGVEAISLSFHDTVGAIPGRDDAGGGADVGPEEEADISPGYELSDKPRLKKTKELWYYFLTNSLHVRTKEPLQTWWAIPIK